MSTANSITRLGYHQLRNLTRLILRQPVVMPSLGSMTLDEDDVQIAQTRLKRPQDWYQTDEGDEFNSRFALWNGSKYAFSFMGGRVALSACIHALRLQPGDEVILPGYTCVVVPNAFHFAGVKIVYSDIELETYGLDARLLKSRITSKTRAILLHHLYGLVCRDYEAIVEIAQQHHLKVIEDCAHATGAAYHGQKVGNLGDVAFYSAEQSKVFNTIQGGVATTNDDQIAEGLREFYHNAPYPDRNRIDRQLHNVVLNYYRFKHPQRWWLGDLAEIRYGHKQLVSTTREEERGIRPAYYGQKMPAPIAALGLNQLKKLDQYNECRRHTAKRWEQWCDENGYQKPLIVDGSIPVFLRYPVLVEPNRKRDRSWSVNELGVQIGVWFVSHIHPTNRRIDGCPNADIAVTQCVNFPGVLP